MCEARSIQVWPSGRMFHYRGDHHSHESVEVKEGEAWTTPSYEDYQELYASIQAEMYVERSVLTCQSSLVDMLLEAGSDGEANGFSYDDIENSCRQESDDDEFQVWNAGANMPGCMPDEPPHPCYSRDHAIEALEETIDDIIDAEVEGVSPGDVFTLENENDIHDGVTFEVIRVASKPSGSDDDRTVYSCYVHESNENWENVNIAGCQGVEFFVLEEQIFPLVRSARLAKESLRKHGDGCFNGRHYFISEDTATREELDDLDCDIDDYTAVDDEPFNEPRDIYEWWLVDHWLCSKLRDIGQPVLDNGYGCWWGRTCTGQSMLMDGTLQAIALEFVPKKRAATVQS